MRATAGCGSRSLVDRRRDRGTPGGDRPEKGNHDRIPPEAQIRVVGQREQPGKTHHVGHPISVRHRMQMVEILQLVLVLELLLRRA